MYIFLLLMLSVVFLVYLMGLVLCLMHRGSQDHNLYLPGQTQDDVRIFVVVSIDPGTLHSFFEHWPCKDINKQDPTTQK